MIKLPKLAFVSRSECDVLIYDSVGKNLMKTFLPEDVVTQSILLREAYPIVCSFRFLWKLLKIVVGKRSPGDRLIVDKYLDAFLLQINLLSDTYQEISSRPSD